MSKGEEQLPVGASLVSENQFQALLPAAMVSKLDNLATLSQSSWVTYRLLNNRKEFKHSWRRRRKLPRSSSKPDNVDSALLRFKEIGR